MADKNFIWITTTVLFVILGGTGIYLMPTGTYDVCRLGNTYGTWSLMNDSVKVNDKDLSAVGLYHCDIEDKYKYCGRITKTRCYEVLEEISEEELHLYEDTTCVKNKTIKYYKNIVTNKTKEICIKCDTKNKSCKEYCYEDIEYFTKKVKYQEEQCIEYDTRFIYNEKIFEPEKEDKKCKSIGKKIICDDTIGGDGNGDGICASGETCYTYDLTDKIELKSIKNGDKELKTRLRK